MGKVIKSKLASRMLVWLLVVSMVVTGLPMQQASAAESLTPQTTAADLPIQMQSASAAEPYGFQDVSPSDWYYKAARYVQQNGIFSGTGEGLFSPKGTLTRAMYVTALGRMAGVNVSEYTTTSFADVPAGIWYAPYVEWAAKQGITSGTGNGRFAPETTVSREQMATMTVRYFESYQIPYQSDNPVTTVPGDLDDISTWAADAVLKLWRAGIFSGDSKGNFNPRAQASRAESAVLFMRNHEVVKAWEAQHEPTETTKPESGENSNENGSIFIPSSSFLIKFESNGGSAVASQSVTYGARAQEPAAPTKTGYAFGGWYSDSDLQNAYSFAATVTGSQTLYAKWLSINTVSFDSNGGSTVASIRVTEGEALRSIPAPVKDGYIFQGWFKDSDLTLIFANGSTVSEDMTLYAKYIENISDAVQSVPSIAALDVAPNFTIEIEDVSNSLTAADVENGLTFHDISDPDAVGIAITGTDGLFTIKSAAEDGLFEEGNTYQVTLLNDNLIFADQDETTDIYVFSVAKEESMNVPLNPNMKYLRFGDVTDMMLDGADAGSPAIPVVSTTVGDNEAGLTAANARSGTFMYAGGTSIQVGDTVAVYEGIRPDLRTAGNDEVEDGAVAYVKIKAINGNRYTFGNADSKDVLFRPDILPVSVDADQDNDVNNHSITVERSVMNYSDSLYEPFGLSELTTVDVGDFIGFYEGVFAEEDSEVVGYGRIISVTDAAELLIIAYTDATLDDIESVFDIYQQQALDGDLLLTSEDIARIEDQMKQQAIASGFVDQAANYLSALAMQTDEFKALPQRMVLAPSGGVGSVSVENVTVVPRVGTTLYYINGRTSGVSATLQVGADIVIRIHEESDLVIHMTGTFLEEISLSLGIDGDMQGHWEYFWGIPYWYTIDDYVVTVNLDAYTYTGINITAKIATIEHDKLQDVLDDWDRAVYGGMLGKIRDISTEIQALIDGVQDTDVDDESLRAQYQEMMENETDWVTLIKKELVSKSVRVALGIIEVNFTAEFVVKANVNLTIGADFNYTTAKRYSATLRVLSFTGSSDTVSLPGDGDYQFTFYVMGTLGLRAGLSMEVKAGIGSVSLNSIGIAIEPGAYINLWGYFYYQKKKLNGVDSSRSLGALLIEIGIYLESAVGAQLGDGLLSASIPIYENQWPLYSVGEQQHAVDFAYSQDDAPTVQMAGSAWKISVPESLLTMSTFDLKTGEMSTQAYDPSRFDFQVDSRDFMYLTHSGEIAVTNRNTWFAEGNMVITWKGAPLSYSSEKVTRTIPLQWQYREGDYTLKVDPMNGDPVQIISAPYNSAIGAVATPAKQGYTFGGWKDYGGGPADVPERMPPYDTNLYAIWIPNTDTPYTVHHYLIDPNTKKPTTTTPAYTETLTGTTDTEIQINSDRFADQGYATGTARGVKIRGDGSSSIRVDYYPENRTMTFDWGYAGAPSSSITEAAGKNIAARVPMPSRPGYTFAGWSPAVPATMSASNTSYTAMWTPKEDTPYQVVYLLQNIGGDTYTVADTESYSGTTDTTAGMTNPTKTFEGFVFDSSVAGTVTSATISGKGNTVLKLYYKRNTYAMTINYNHAGASNNVLNVPYGATTQLYLGTPSRAGYTFTGWSPANVTTMPAQAVEFTAQWTLNTHTVSFNSNGGSTVADQTVGYGSLATEPATPTKDGLVFGGWYSDSTLTTAYDFSSQVTADLTLYAKWLRSFTVRFDSGDGSPVPDQTVNEGGKATAPSAPTLEDYVFGGWYRDSALTIAYDFESETVTANLTLYAKWTEAPKIYYTISFNTNGGTSVQDMTVLEGAVATSPSAPTRTGYTFEGWYTDNSLTSASRFNFSLTSIMSDLTLYAKWTINTYTVTFESNGGSTVASQTVNYDGTATSPAAPTRSGYAFGGWYSDALLTTPYIFSTPVRAHITLYAKWMEVYTVSFHSNEGSSVPSQQVESGGKAVEPTAPTMDGYTFIGWYSDEELTEAYLFTERPVTSNITLYAKWSLNSFTVTFDSNGGPTVSSQPVTPGGQAVAPTVQKRMGYLFDGWYSDDTLQTAYDFSTPVNADLTLYAKWTMTWWLELGNYLQSNAYDHSKVVVDSQGTAYVGMVLNNAQVYVEKYVEATDEWQVIGGPGTLPDAWGYSIDISLAIDSQNQLYVAYAARIDTTWNTVVYRYDGGEWELVGDTNTHLASYTNMLFDNNGTPYLVYESYSNPAGIVVKRLNDGQWQTVDSFAAGDVGNIQAEFDENNTLYVYYTTFFNGGTEVQAFVFKYENGSAPRISLGNPPLPGGYMASSFKLDPSGVPYVVNAKDGKVVKYENNAWGPVGTAVFPIYSHGGTATADLTFDSEGVPYLAYIGTDYLVTVMKFDNNAWSIVENAGIATAHSSLRVNVDSNDNIYVNFIRKADVNMSSSGKEIVLKYDPDYAHH